MNCLQITVLIGSRGNRNDKFRKAYSNIFRYHISISSSIKPVFLVSRITSFLPYWFICLDVAS